MRVNIATIIPYFPRFVSIDYYQLIELVVSLYVMIMLSLITTLTLLCIQDDHHCTMHNIHILPVMTISDENQHSILLTSIDW